MATLLGVPLSPYVRKVLILVEEGGIPVEYCSDERPFPPSERLLAVNPRGKIPALEDGDLKLGESSVICAYLDRAYGPSGLYPEDPKAFAQALWFERYMEECVMPAIGPVFVHRLLAPVLGLPVKPEAITEAIEERQPPVFAYLNDQLAGRDTLDGDAFTIGDAAVVSAFINLEAVDGEIDGHRYPELVRYLAVQNQRPSVDKWRQVTLEAAAGLRAMLP